jgi:Cu(I)/Ag(I) efflux system membrane protein CusA/SilA
MANDASNLSAWDRVVRFFLRQKPLVFGVTGLLVVAGLMVQPFDWNPADLPRNRVAVDAIPNTGENQQIVFTEWPGRSPRDIEDQITYPLTTQLMGLPGVKTIRSTSMLGFSSIYVIFERDVDFYWARSRILEKLNSLPPDTLPEGVTPNLGPDATALGQIYWYTLQGRNEDGETVGGWDLHELRTIQDWSVRYALQSVQGVAEVASIGGHVKEYQINVDPETLRAYDIPITQVADAVRQSNRDVGARTMEINQIEYVLRGVGQLESLEALRQTTVTTRNGKPVRVGDLGQVRAGPSNRRGALDYEGAETVGGVVVARHGANPVEVIDGVKSKINEISAGLPTRKLEDGTTSQVEIVPYYDRSKVVEETLGTLSDALVQQILITIIVVLILLGHLRSSAVISILLPLAVLGSFLLMKAFDVTANVMSLAGIAIAIGTMVDMGIVLTENMVEKLNQRERDGEGASESRQSAIRDGAAEVAPAVLTSVVSTVISFLPVFGLTAAEGELFHPLAFTKTFAIVAAYLLSVLVLPTLVYLLVWPAVSPPDEEASVGWRLIKALARPTHLRDWLFVALGVATIVFGATWIGMFVVLVALLRFSHSLLPMRWRRATPWIEIGLAVGLVTWALTQAWMPLGYGTGQWLNLIFVVAVNGGLLALFWGFMAVYPYLLRIMLRYKKTFLTVPIVICLFGATAWLGFGTVWGWVPDRVENSEPIASVSQEFPGFQSEFMPPFDEGQFLYMPTTTPHASMGAALGKLQKMDKRISKIPEVKEVVGKLGRMNSALDPAPVSMFETIITYEQEWAVNEDGERVRQWRDHIESTDDIWEEIVDAAQQPGLTGAPKLMPIQTRLVMLQSGMRAPMGIKVRGPDLETIEEVAQQLEGVLKGVNGIPENTVVAQRIVGKPYLEIDIDREAIGRHGATVADVQKTLSVALGGMPLTQSIEGRQRFPIRVRYQRDERMSPQALERLSVSTRDHGPVPLGQLAEIRYEKGPKSIRAEDTFLTTYVTFDRSETVGQPEVVRRAKQAIEQHTASGDLSIPQGVSYEFAGSYKDQVRSEARLRLLIPLALLLIFVAIYLQFGRTTNSLIIFSAVAVACSGGFGLIWLYNQPWFLDVTLFGRQMQDLFQIGQVSMSVAVWIGFIALVGIAVDDGVVMMTYLRQRMDALPPTTVPEVRERVLEAGLRRVRPCLMTTATTLLALLPVITSQGRGADVMVPMALPVVGGMAVELVTLFVVPVLYAWTEELSLSDSDDHPPDEVGESA